MSTSSKHSNRTRKAAASQAAPRKNEPATQSTLDTVLRDCSQTTTKEQLGWEIAAGSALLRGAQQMREAQLDASRKAQQAHADAAASLRQAYGISDLANIQASLARADLEGALELWGRLSELASRSALELWNESFSGVTRMQTAAWSSAQQWFEHQASLGTRTEVLEAEVEHVANTVAASPLVWPSQEATRQVMTLATSTWNDLLSWSGPFAQAAARAANGAGQRPH